MDKEKLSIIWSEEAANDLENIYNYYLVLSPQGAVNIVNDILEGVDSITLPGMYRQDEFNSKYRRVIARHYKILYRLEGNAIFIARIFDARQDPSKLESL